MVQGCWSWLQNTRGSNQRHLHWSVTDAWVCLRVEILNVHLWFCNIDKKCPFTGEVSIRGRILTGKVVSTKMTRTAIIRRDYLHYIPKYSASGFACVLPLLTVIQTDTRRDTRTWPFMFHRLSVWRLVTL